MLSRTTLVMALAGAALIAPAGAMAQGVEVIYCKINLNPKATVPGATDIDGNPAATEFRSLEDLVMSPDGKYWLAEGRTQLGSDLENVWILGTGRCGTKFLQEGDLIPGGLPNERYEFFGSGLGRFNDNNQFGFTARARTGPTGTTSPANGQRVLLWNGSTVSVLFAQGDLISGLVDTTVSGDETFGNSVGSAHLLNNGVVGLQDSTIGNISTTRRPAIMYDNEAFHQTNVTTVTGIDGVTPVTWATINANAFYTTPDGAHWMASGRRVGQTGTEFILVRDGAVVIETGTEIGTSGVVPSQLFSFKIAGNGDWVARGTTSGGVAWAVRNGALIAKTGDPITTGSGETWGGTFHHVTLNRLGHWVLLGNTSSADPAADAVAVLDGSTVLFREGDPVDLNGNGAFDDDVFIGRGNNTLVPWRATLGDLTDAGWYYGIISIRDGAGADLNGVPVFSLPDAFIRFRTALVCDADFNASGAATVQDIFDFLEAYFSNDPRSDVNNSCTLTVQDIFDFLAAYFAGC
ncbi:MAG: GC-type dockerin domain-anchored protein [Phycisphaerales bacterium]